MSSEFASDQEIFKKAREEVERKSGKTPEELYAEREKRVMDAIAMKEPDRVPVVMRGGYFPVMYAGLSPSVVFYEPTVYKQAVIKTLLDFEPDSFQLMTNVVSGGALGALDSKQNRWPGGNLPSDVTNQFVEMEIMKADEYDLFITDPTDYWLRYYLPRVFGALAPLSEFSYLGDKTQNAAEHFLKMCTLFNTPGFQEMGQALLKTGKEQSEFSCFDTWWTEEIGDLGFPPIWYPGGVQIEPFDVIAGMLRGFHGTVIDMFKRPEKLIAACERVLERKIARTEPADPTLRGHPRRVQSGAFHYSSDHFLSRKQFETFSWPTYKKALLATIDLGFTPGVFGQGKIDERLEYLLELPKGKFYIRFEQVDIARAKAILGNHCCIGVDVPAALLYRGSPQEVEDYCKHLIKTYGKGGGFILGGGVTLDEAKPANVKAFVDAVKKYGQY